MAEVRRLMETDLGFDPAVWRAVADEGFVAPGLSFAEQAVVLEEAGAALLCTPLLGTVAATAAGAPTRALRRGPGRGRGRRRVGRGGRRPACHRRRALVAPRRPQELCARRSRGRDPCGGGAVGRRARVLPRRRRRPRPGPSAPPHAGPHPPAGPPDLRGDARPARRRRWRRRAGARPGARPGVRGAGRRAGRRGPALPRHDRRPCAGPGAVRPADRKLPGRPAPVRRHAAGGGVGSLRRHVRGVHRERGPDDLPAAAALAKATCSDAYAFVAAETIHLHGGVGFTWDHDAHLYFKRAKSSRLLFGDPRHHREQLARHIRI